MADGDWNWEDLTNLFGDVAGDLSNMVLDTQTGQLVDIATLSPQDLADLDMSGSPSGSDPSESFGPSAPGRGAPGGPTGTSLSDQIRSEMADPNYMPPGSEPFDPNAMADPSASIASADALNGNGWMKALAQGLGNALGGLGGSLKGLPGLGADTGGGLRAPNVPGMMSASVPGFDGAPTMGAIPSGAGGSGLLGTPDGGGLAGLGGLGRLQDAPGAAAVQGSPALQAAVAALLRDQASANRLPSQGPIDAGPAPPKFSPLMLPVAGPAPAMAQAPQPRMSGLQRLALERLG